MILGAGLGILVPALILACFHTTAKLKGDLEARVRVPMRQYADVLARGMGVAIWTEDRIVATELMDAVMSNPDVVSIAVVNEYGEVFSSKDRPELRTGDLLREEREIIYKGVSIGRVVIEMSMARVRRELTGDVLNQGIALAAQVCMSFLFVWLLFDRRMIRPLRELEVGASRLARGDFDKPLLRQRRDEIGNLALGMDQVRTDFAALIKERNRALEELKKSESQNRALIRAIPDPIFTNRRNGEYLAVHASEQILPSPPESLVHRNVEEVLPGPIATRLLNAYGRAFDYRTVQEVHYSLSLEGQIRSFEARVVPCTEESVLTIVRDVTERRRAEELQRSLEAQLQQSQKMESLGSLAGGVAHDMNNVLGAILALSTAHLQIQPPGSPVYQAFDTISKAAARGGKMVKSLLSLARQSPAEERELDLNALLLEEVRLLERTTLSRVRLEMDFSPGLHPILGDPSALTHAFMNLCVNAVDAMPDDGTLTLRTRNVDSRWVEVQVEDTGTGMPQHVLEKAMDPFFTTKEQGKGTGLGLSLVYSTVKAHGGQIEIHSEVGEGTQVSLRFPACEPATQPGVVAAESGPGPTRGPMTVLLVDDDELIRSSVKGILELLGHSVTTAGTGEEALAKLEAGLLPSLVILDMNMPGLGGAGTLPLLRTRCPKLPVLLATGRADSTSARLVENDPFVTLLPKPFSVAELQIHLKALGLRGATS